jgi:two-component system sensor histidine kinase ChiS
MKIKIEKYLNIRTSSFMVLTKEYHCIIGSNIKLTPGDKCDLSKNMIKNNIQSEEGLLNYPVKYRGSTYSYFIETKPYPYIILIGETDFSMSNELKDIVMPQIIKTVFLGVAFIVLLYFFRMKVVNPMVVLSQKARQLSQGDYEVKMPTVNSLEANNLVEALELVKKAFYRELEMRSEISVANHQIKTANELLEYKVKERTIDLERALAAKAEFLNNMSHEIRTPIHGIINFADFMLDNWENISNDEKNHCAKRIQYSSNRLLSLINNLLDLSKLSSSKMDFNFEEHDFIKAVKEVIGESEPLYNKNKISIELIHNEKINCSAFFDKTRIEQVIRNLVANAIKFTDQGKIIIEIKDSSITLEQDNFFPALEFCIKDQGIGVPQKELEEIFGKFTQSTRTKTGAGGTGLGLSICQEIISAHQGLIWAENNPDKGAKFIFVIPKQQRVISG